MSEIEQLRVELAQEKSAHSATRAVSLDILREIQRRTDGVTDIGWHGLNELRVLLVNALEKMQ